MSPRVFLEPGACKWCGEALDEHPSGLCPMVRAFSFDRRGRIVRVEYLTPADLVDKPQAVAEPEADYPRKKGH